MSVGTVETFLDRLAALDVATSEVAPADCAARIDEVAGDPAVGVPLEGADVRLPDRVNSEPTAADLRAAHTGVTDASLGVAAYGSVAIEADAEGTEPVSLFVDRHVAVLRESALVADMSDAYEWLGPRTRDADADVVFATGPSATADMGGLVRGAHGPKEVHVILVTGADDE